MKRLLLFTFAFLTITGIGTVATTSPTLALTKAQKQNCYDKFNGHGTGRGTDNKLTQKLQKQFNDSKCPSSKGGNCGINGSSQGAIITCKDPSPAKSPTSSGDTIKDPALDCDRSECDIVSNYVNPLINLLTVLVGIAVVIGIIIGAIQVLSSAGDPQKAASGKGHVQNAVIAAIAYLVLFAFLQWIIPGGI